MLDDRKGQASVARVVKARTKASRGPLPFPQASDLAPLELDLERPFVVRYLNATSNKPLHLGHLRNIALGEATVGTLTALGAQTVRHCIVEDTGRFVSEAMVALARAEAAGEVIPPPGPRSDHFIGTCYANYRRALRHSSSVSSAGKGNEAASTDYAARNDDADEMMRRLGCGESDAIDLRDRVRGLALAGQQATLQRLGVAFDYCDFEAAEDQGMPDFLERCDRMKLLETSRDGDRTWLSSLRERLRLVNKAGLCEESARLLSFNARVSQCAAGAFQTLVFAGSEWKASMRLYPEFLAAYGADLTAGYLPTFCGMVKLDGKKMASSTGTGVLVDNLLKEVAVDRRILKMVSECGDRASACDLAVFVIRALLLATGRTEPVEFSMEALMGPETNPGWRIAAAWSRSAPHQGGRASEACRRILKSAAARRSYEEAIKHAESLAEPVLISDAHASADFCNLIRALALSPGSRGFTFSGTPSFLNAAPLECRPPQPLRVA